MKCLRFNSLFARLFWAKKSFGWLQTQHINITLQSKITPVYKENQLWTDLLKYYLHKSDSSLAPGEFFMLQPRKVDQTWAGLNISPVSFYNNYFLHYLATCIIWICDTPMFVCVVRVLATLFHHQRIKVCSGWSMTLFSSPNTTDQRDRLLDWRYRHAQ